MGSYDFPRYLSDRIFSQKEVLEQTVVKGARLTSGFASSEPFSFYRDLWDHIRDNDVVDLKISNGLFMAPHKICVGDALSAKGSLTGAAEKLSFLPPAAKAAKKINAATQKLDGLKKLINHYKEIRERKILFESGFIGPANNMVIPDNLITRFLYPEFAGRNTTRMGITDMHSIHFPDAMYSLAYDVDEGFRADVFVTVMTPPNKDGDMSLGPANGVNAEMIQKILDEGSIGLIVYMNPGYPFTQGYGSAKNTFNVSEFKGLAESGNLFVVEDDGKVPAFPAGSFANPAKAELAIADHLVNHIEMNRGFTYGRPIQVGIGGTGVLAIKRLKDSSWEGRQYSEMLEPFTFELFEAGKIKGTHFVEEDGRRTPLDGKIVCTFSICEEGNDFYQKIDNNDSVIVAGANRVVIPEAFFGGMGINNILGIDFNGHVNSGGRYRNHHSGIGGAAMINRGLAKGGVSYLCLKSTHTTVEGERRSSVFPAMPEGTPISLVGPDVWGGRDMSRMYLVTEQGVTRLSGKSQSEFVKSVISVAHPDFRGFLKKEAWRLYRIAV